MEYLVSSASRNLPQITRKTAFRMQFEAATNDARRLCAGLCERFKLDGDELLIFYSGSKGFHVGLPVAMWNPEPSVTFNQVTRRFTESIAEHAGVVIECGINEGRR